MKNIFKIILTTISGMVVFVGILFSVFFITSAIGIVGEMIFNLNLVKENIAENMKPFYAGSFYVIILTIISVVLFLSYLIGEYIVKDKES